MKMEHHAIVTAPVAIGTYYFTHSWFYTLVSVFSGFLVDFDHVFDYIREEKRFSLKDMFVKSYLGDFKKLYIIFHAFEYVPLVWIITLFVKDYTFAVVFTISYLSHMIPDQMANNTKPFGYFLTYRIKKKFDMKELFYFPQGVEPGFIRKRQT
ncbi:MAG: hypothetical protein KA120_01660 [Candidatus Goldbacteria bacterium]|nr:hypothetical protein [Candidatus Goldiibacteriota bacterium]